MPMSNFTSQQMLSFNKDGFIIIKNFCADLEIKRLQSEALNGRIQLENEGVLTDLTHSEKVVTTIAQLLQSNSPVCHIQAKFIEKLPNYAGSWAWHQDYAWWYMNGLLFPDQIMNFAVALTPSNKETGCSQLIKGSHKLGRLDHGFGDSNKTLGADSNMVNYALESLELVNIELAPGDAIFFHSNLLHRCEPNLSDSSSWFIVSTYASQENLATNDTLSAWHQPIEVISNEEILERNGMYLSEENFVDSKRFPILSN
jgi:ectoine hydroxylase-related dioxygenase (phytanoyl-CoA dioxygenase family)